MEKEKERDKQVSVSPALFADFERMADSYGLTNKALLETMIRYFQATKADPRDPKSDNPTDAIKALDKRLISFIRQQEKQILKPMHDNMQILNNSGQEQMATVNTYMKAIAEALDGDLLKNIRLSHIRTIGGAIRPELLTEPFKKVYEDVKNTKPGPVKPGQS
ncbi:BfmA/BtgA family mobilization protein [Spirosoma jeollabukense]